ncbi:MAG: BamA/TamA family outer membrane protein [Cytophagales bacterium]|nr:BamA/TamA family outer membrane protein [Armatimonadota bacterium]
MRPHLSPVRRAATAVIRVSALCVLPITVPVRAQDTTPSVPLAPAVPVTTPAPLDQVTPVAPVAPSVPPYVRARQLSDADTKKKREGTFITGLPDFSSDPVAGTGYGVRGSIYWNGKRTDPLFAYTPYRAKLNVNAFATSGQAREFTLSYDMPYVNGSRWRIKVDAKLRQDPTNLYFGITDDTLGPLRLPSTPEGGPTYSKFSDFERARKTLRAGGPGEAAFVTDSLSNRFEDKEVMLNLKADYALGDNGRWRVLGGYEIQHLSYETFQGRDASAIDPVTGASTTAPNGTSLLARDAAAGRAKGLEGGLLSILQQAIIFDTRDFEPDPTRGVYFEAANELALPAIGSAYAFDKLFFQAKGFKRLPFGPRTVLAGRVGVGNIFGSDAPFFEFQDQWSPDGSVNALGGARSLRGYRANRFMARAMWFANIELRTRLAETVIGRQRFALSVAPFVDAGTVRDKWQALNFNDVRTSYGYGARLAWNQSTIISFDFAKSKEDELFFFGLGQAF